MKKDILLKAGAITAPIIFSLVFLTTGAMAEPYGWSPNVDNSWGGPPTCTDSKPDKAPIQLPPNHSLLGAPAKNEVRVWWHKVPGATGYNIYYGLSPHNYIFSAPDLPDTDRYYVGHLTAGRYYFAVQAKRGCAAGNLSNELWSVPGGRRLSTGGVTNNFVPARTAAPTPTVAAPEPTAVEAVQGVEEYQPPVVQENPPAVNPNPFVPLPTPKPLNFWQKLLRIFIK
ncbi:hypothetical protein A3I51_02310 [Candidatus Gottesmanbacteria bacterium RIFCSPLOWO2_02_FULL_38_8]|uniref:Fibronectin type-III domain-containing protein n=1 Tax=Candidatus Gottesmanbacteria bacterium RIFCSPLOWO2_02_FULL_38_8 TaxID=1798397 RepID=A0A1F6B2J9_9BACT|nr:MAG: hypothetical protein A3I51_02310 [Candidatus Gottesmanbacteria bacterium RIFCSPLOWO2_02_FULL_38_8]